MDASFVYMTAGSLEEARRIARTLVEERHAACVNVIDGMRSVYRWQGAVEEALEVVMIAKTTAAAFEGLARRVRELHSYDCPCVVRLEIRDGDPAYLAWIGEQTGPG